MKYIYLPLLAITLWSCGNSEKKDDRSNNDTSEMKSDTLVSKNDDAVNLDTVDLAFFEHASYGGMIEVESSNKILAVTLDSGVVDFAKMMLTDHGNANEKLKALAESKGYKLPSALPDRKIQLINKMDEMKDEGRNEYYLLLMISEHQQALDWFSRASRSKDAEISAFAKSIHPVLTNHYEHIQKLYSDFQKPKLKGGDDPSKISDRNKQKG